MYDRFTETLGRNGDATARLILPPLSPIHAGTVAFFAFGCPYDYASNPVAIEITD
jgi:hypothetical protein